MVVFYILSIIFLILNFMMFKKNDKKQSLLSWIVFSICLMYCYNIVIVYFNSLLGIISNFLVLSITNLFVGSIFLFINKKRKKFQEYHVTKKELVSFLLIILITFGVAYVRFNGFTSITYESGDSGIHYRSALLYSKTNEVLNSYNAPDIVYGSFNRFMSAAYINGGILINILFFIKSYSAFILFDVITFILSSLLFLCTCLKLLESNKKIHLYCVVITVLYALGFPLNNMIFGFYYLGIGVMVINLLLLTILYFDDNLKDNKILKIAILFIITFSNFNSYYLFMPAVYLGLGLYYIYSFYKKKINFSELLMYGIVTLLIPFAIGFVWYMLPTIVNRINNKGDSFIDFAKYNGYIYRNDKAIYLFIVTSIYMIIETFRKKYKWNYFNISLITISLYITIFFILFKLGLSGFYYFNKLFYLYSVFLFLILVVNFFNKKFIIYILTILIIVFMFITVYKRDNVVFTKKLADLNIYNWNIDKFRLDYDLFNIDEIELMEKAMEYADECEFNQEFLLTGSVGKNIWFYSITNFVPVPNHIYGYSRQLQRNNINLEQWELYPNHKCLIYYYFKKEQFVYENNRTIKKNTYYTENFDDYEILYKNKTGLILKK